MARRPSRDVIFHRFRARTGGAENCPSSPPPPFSSARQPFIQKGGSDSLAARWSRHSLVCWSSRDRIGRRFQSPWSDTWISRAPAAYTSVRSSSSSAVNTVSAVRQFSSAESLEGRTDYIGACVVLEVADRILIPGIVAPRVARRSSRNLRFGPRTESTSEPPVPRTSELKCAHLHFVASVSRCRPSLA